MFRLWATKFWSQCLVTSVPSGWELLIATSAPLGSDVSTIWGKWLWRLTRRKNDLFTCQLMNSRNGIKFIYPFLSEP